MKNFNIFGVHSKMGSLKNVIFSGGWGGGGGAGG